MPRYAQPSGLARRTRAQVVARVRVAVRTRAAHRLGAGVAVATAVLALLTVPAGAAQGAPRPLALRYALTGYLGVEQAGDALLSCQPGSTAAGEPCAAAQAGGLVGNDDYPMSYLDTDSVPGTFNSSTAQLYAPPGGTIAFAGLYWGGDSGVANDAGTTGCQSAPSANQVTAPPAPGRAGQVLVNVGGAGYRGVAASTVDTLSSSLGGGTFQGFADVTALFQRFSGATTPTPIPVTVANVQLAQGRNCAGGWTVVVVYTLPAADPIYAPGYRSVQLFDGLATVAPGSPVSAAASGFRVASDGAPTAGQVGVVLYDGDRGSAGDQLSVNGVPAGDDLGDSTVEGSAYGAGLDSVGAVAPNLGNALGYDSRVVDLPAGALPPGVTSANAAIGTTGDQVTVGALVLVSRVDPLLAVARSVTRADGSNAAGADVVTGAKLRYTLTLQALTPLTAVGVADALPAGLTPVPGSLTVNGAPADPSVGALTGGSAAVSLPALDPAAPVVVTYDVTVTAAAPAGVPLVSRATLHYTAGGVALDGFSPQVSVLANRIDLALTQKAGAPAVTPGHPVLLTVTLHNQGKAAASGISVSEPVPAGLVVTGADADQGSFDGPSGTWTVGALAAGASTALRLTVAPGSPPGPAPGPSGTPVPSAAPTAPADPAPVTFAVTATAEISGADQPDVDSLPGDALPGEDDQAAVALTVTAIPPVSSAAPSPDGVLGAATRPNVFQTNSMITILAAVLGAALIMIGAMVLVSARRRRLDY